jgi:TonB family protein
MNAIFITGLTILAASASISATPSHAEDCGMRVVQSKTDFPIRSQMRGLKGTVVLNVTLDEKGHVTGAEVDRSSGHLSLDLAAARSVRDQWQFDVTDCNHQWPATHQVAVEYRNEEYQ